MLAYEKFFYSRNQKSKPWDFRDFLWLAVSGFMLNELQKMMIQGNKKIGLDLEKQRSTSAPSKSSIAWSMRGISSESQQRSLFPSKVIWLMLYYHCGLFLWNVVETARWIHYANSLILVQNHFLIFHFSGKNCTRKKKWLGSP